MRLLNIFQNYNIFDKRIWKHQKSYLYPLILITLILPVLLTACISSCSPLSLPLDLKDPPEILTGVWLVKSTSFRGKQGEGCTSTPNIPVLYNGKDIRDGFEVSIYQDGNSLILPESEVTSDDNKYCVSGNGFISENKVNFTYVGGGFKVDYSGEIDRTKMEIIGQRLCQYNNESKTATSEILMIKQRDTLPQMDEPWYKSRRFMFDTGKKFNNLVGGFMDFIGEIPNFFKGLFTSFDQSFNWTCDFAFGGSLAITGFGLGIVCCALSGFGDWDSKANLSDDMSELCDSRGKGQAFLGWISLAFLVSSHLIIRRISISSDVFVLFYLLAWFMQFILNSAVILICGFAGVIFTLLTFRIAFFISLLMLPYLPAIISFGVYCAVKGLFLCR